MSPLKETAQLAYRRGVGIVLSNKNGQVFIGKRAPKLNQKLSQPWQFPQGGIEKGESPEKAAVRELAEETGVTSIKIVTVFPEWLYYDLPKSIADSIWEGKYKGQKQKWFLCTFLGFDNEINLQIDGSPEFVEWKWVDFSEAIKLAVPFKQTIYERLEKKFFVYLKNQSI